MMERALAWLTERERSTYGVAVTRMMIGFVVSSQLLLNWPDRSYTWGEGGRWNEPVADVKGYPGVFGLFRALGGWQWDVAYLLVVLSGIALMLGVFTRITTVTTVILWTSLYVANPYVGSGGDAVLRMVLFYLCFTDAGRSGRSTPGARTRGAPGCRAVVSATLHNLAVDPDDPSDRDGLRRVGAVEGPEPGLARRDGGVLPAPDRGVLAVERPPAADHSANSLFVSGATYRRSSCSCSSRCSCCTGPLRMVALVMITGMHLAIGLHGHHVLLARDDRGRHDARQRQDVALCCRHRQTTMVSAFPRQGRGGVTSS